MGRNFECAFSYAAFCRRICDAWRHRKSPGAAFAKAHNLLLVLFGLLVVALDVILQVAQVFSPVASLNLLNCVGREGIIPDVFVLHVQKAHPVLLNQAAHQVSGGDGLGVGFCFEQDGVGFQIQLNGVFLACLKRMSLGLRTIADKDGFQMAGAGLQVAELKSAVQVGGQALFVCILGNQQGGIGQAFSGVLIADDAGQCGRFGCLGRRRDQEDKNGQEGRG